MAPPFHGHRRERGARRGEDDREHGEHFLESRGPELAAKDQDDAAKAHADPQQLLRGEAFRFQVSVRHEGGLEGKGGEQDRGEAALDPVVLAPVDESVVRGEQDHADESDERPLGPVLRPLRSEHDRQEDEHDRGDGKPQGGGQEGRRALQADPDREPRGSPDDTEHREGRAPRGTRRHSRGHHGRRVKPWGRRWPCL